MINLLFVIFPLSLCVTAFNGLYMMCVFDIYMQDQLQNVTNECSYENEAFVRVFGKEHLGYVWGMGLGITPTQINGTTQFARSSTSLESNLKIEKMQAEIDTLKEQVAQVDVLKEQIAFLLQNTKGNQVK